MTPAEFRLWLRGLLTGLLRREVTDEILDLVVRRAELTFERGQTQVLKTLPRDNPG